MDNQITLDKLQAFQEQLLENNRLYSYVNGGCAAEVIEQLEQIKAKIGDFPKAPTVAGSSLQLPLPEDHFKVAQQEKDQRWRLFLLVGGITAALLLIYFISHVQFFNTLSVIGIFATIVVGWFHKISADAYKKKKDQYETAQKLYTSTRADFHKALSSYEAEIAEALKQYTLYELRYYENYPVFKDTVFSFGTKMEAANEALEKSDAQIAQNGFISEEYYHLVPAIISMLKSGRADSYKEALNMAIEEERQNAIEAARREEENRRIEAMERQAEEERRHNMEMERQQEAHNRAMERAEQDKAEAQRRAAIQADKDRRRAESEAFHQRTVAESEARKQAAQTRMAGVSKCANCRNNRRCPSHIKESGAGLTCGGYQPY